MNIIFPLEDAALICDLGQTVNRITSPLGEHAINNLYPVDSPLRLFYKNIASSLSLKLIHSKQASKYKAHTQTEQNKTETFGLSNRRHLKTFHSLNQYIRIWRQVSFRLQTNKHTTE